MTQPRAGVFKSAAEECGWDLFACTIRAEKRTVTCKAKMHMRGLISTSFLHALYPHISKQRLPYPSFFAEVVLPSYQPSPRWRLIWPMFYPCPGVRRTGNFVCSSVVFYSHVSRVLHGQPPVARSLPFAIRAGSLAFDPSTLFRSLPPPLPQQKLQICSVTLPLTLQK